MRYTLVGIERQTIEVRIGEVRVVLVVIGEGLMGQVQVAVSLLLFSQSAVSFSQANIHTTLQKRGCFITMEECLFISLHTLMWSLQIEVDQPTADQGGGLEVCILYLVRIHEGVRCIRCGCPKILVLY